MTKPNSRRQLVSHELLEHAARLFAEQGYAGTSLQDIADAMGVSRPSIYTYVRNKEELLSALLHDVLDPPVRILQEAHERDDLSADERLEEAVHQLAVNSARNTLRFRLLDRSEPHLPKKLATQHRESRRRVLALLTALIEDATQTGAFRPLPARTVALSIMGMVNWTAWWYRPEVDGPAEDIAEVIVDMALHGIRQTRGQGTEAGPWGAVAMLREDLNHLEQTLSAAVPQTSAAKRKRKSAD